jgi:hypothetical protein
VPQRQHGHSITGVILTPTPTKPLAGMVINKLNLVGLLCNTGNPRVTGGSLLRRLRGPRRLDALLPSSFQSPPLIGHRRRFQTKGRRRPWNTAVTTTTSARMR